MPISGLFEVSARIIRRHAPLLLVIAVTIQLAGAVLVSGAQELLGTTIGPLLVGMDTDSPQLLTPTDDQARAIIGAALLVGAATLVALVLGAIATVGYAQVVANDYHARPSTVGPVLAVALRRALPAVLASVLSSLAALATIVATVALALGAVVILPGADGSVGGVGAFIALIIAVGGALLAVTLLVRLSLATVAVAVEGIGARAGLGRSWHLTGDNSWRTFAVLALVAFIVSILAALLGQLLGVTISDTLGVRLGMVQAFDALFSAAIAVLFAPVAVVVCSVLYFDLRVRRDAWDLPAPDVDGPSLNDGSDLPGV